MKLVPAGLFKCDLKSPHFGPGAVAHGINLHTQEADTEGLLSSVPISRTMYRNSVSKKQDTKKIILFLVFMPIILLPPLDLVIFYS